MPEVHEGSCFLCTYTSSYQIIDAGQRKWFSCGTCKSFIVSDEAEKWLALRPELKIQLSEQSFALPDERLLHIYVSGLRSGVGDDQEKLETKTESKSTWIRRST